MTTQNTDYEWALTQIPVVTSATDCARDAAMLALGDIITAVSARLKDASTDAGDLARLGERLSADAVGVILNRYGS